jgi:hypothetical protein
MSKTVKRYVSVYNPETGDSETLKPGMKVPDYATDQVTNPKVFEDPEPSDNEAPVNESTTAAPGGEVPEGVDGTTVTAMDGTAEPAVDPGPVNETVNANPAQRDTAGKPGGNQAPEDGGLAPADDPQNTASSIPATEPTVPPVDVVSDEDTAPAKKTAAKKTTAKKTASKRS